MINIILLLFALIPCFAQENVPEEKDRRGIFEIAEREKKDLFEKVRQNPSNRDGPNDLSSVVTYRLYYGQTYSRQDLENSDQSYESFTNKKSRTFAIDMSYFLSSWFNFSAQIDYIDLQKIRYDGFSVPQSEKRKMSYSFGSLVSFYNIFISVEYFISKRFLPVQNSVNQLNTVDERTFWSTIGTRIYLKKPLALDLFFSYGKPSLKYESLIFDDESLYRVGARLYWAGDLHFGLEVYEETFSTNVNSLKVEEQVFGLLPYWRF